MSQGSSFSQNIINQKYAHELEDGSKETWTQIAYRVAKEVLSAINIGTDSIEFFKIFDLINRKVFIPGGRYLYASGRPFHQVNNCLLLRASDSREGWSELMQKSSMALMTGAGIGVDYSDVRPKGSPIRKTGGLATGPLALMQMVNEAGRHIQQGGARRAALWAGLRWSHKDVMEFISIKDWSAEVRALKAKDYNFPATLDGTNVSVILDKDFFDAYGDPSDPSHVNAQAVYWKTVSQMVSTSEPGFSVDYDNSRESLRNACSELVSEDTDDICNLGSINMSKVNTLEEMHDVVHYGTLFLMAGTIYSDVPYEDVRAVRTKNRRLGLGLMGVHEWLLSRGKKYGIDKDLEKFLQVYALSGDYANDIADRLGVSRPVKTRAIAPAGTISIVAETTSGIEPMLCAAYKRRYLSDGTQWKYEYVIDPAARRMIEKGVDPSIIEDAYSLANDVERRVAFQAWVQQYVDHAISSTINLPAWGSAKNNEETMIEFGNMLINYLPKLRGVTCYADGSRSGQPITAVPIEEAMAQIGKVHYETGDVCDLTKGGTCSS